MNTMAQASHLQLRTARISCRVRLTCDPEAACVPVSNGWDAFGVRRAERWMAAGAMLVESVPGGIRRRCNDAYPDTDFDDLVFRVIRDCTAVVFPQNAPPRE